MQVKLPVNDKLEAFVLCSAINSSYAAAEIIGICTEEDFYSLKNKIIFSSLKSLSKTGIFITLQSLLFEISKQDKKAEVDNQYVTSLVFEYWSGMPFEQYTQDLKKLTLLRKIIYSSQEMIAESAQDNAEPDKILSKHQDIILKAQGLATKSILSAEDISNNFNKDKSFSDDMLWRQQQRLQGKKTYEGISSGFPILDMTLGSFQNGCLYTIGARTSMGKTTFMLNLIRNILRHNRVGVFSLEMSSALIYSKLACIEYGICYRNYFDGIISRDDFKRFCQVEEKFSKLPLFIDDEANLNTQKLEARANRFKLNKKIDILFIDYLTRVKCCGKYFSKHLEIDEITKSLQAMAKTLNIPIVVLAQLNRQTISATKTRPSMIDFKESGSIEEDSDACILLHRPDYYSRMDKPGIMEVIVDKNRIMGTRRTIEFKCNSLENERYEELKEVSDYVHEAKTENETRPKIEHLSFAARYGDDDS